MKIKEREDTKYVIPIKTMDLLKNNLRSTDIIYTIIFVC